MTPKQNLAAVAAVALLTVLGGLGVSANAAESAGDDAQEQAAIANAKITQCQAIAIAEQAAGGKSTASGIENEDGKTISYEITVDKAGTPQKVLVDMQTGKVVSMVAEKAGDGEEGEDGKEDDGKNG